MNNNFDNIFNYPNFHNIFSEKDIYIDHSNLNFEKNYDFDEQNIKNTFEPCDILFNNKNSRLSSYDENEFQKLSLKPYIHTPEAKNIFNINDSFIKEPNMKENLNKKRKLKNKETKKEIKDIKDIKENKEVNNQIDKKIIFNSYKLTPLSEEEKLEQKEKNRISARKSRFKKKQYITKLEQEHSLLLNQLEEIRQNLGINKKIIPLKETKAAFTHKNENFCDNCSKIENLKEEEKLIINNDNYNEKSNINLLNSYSENQKKILEKLFINQILIMMPIKIKIFQNKYLKLFTFNKEESLNDIKNKIEKNLQTIQELYDINNLNNEENGIKNEQKYNKKNKGVSMAQQIYNYYYNLKNFIKEFEKIYLSLI